MIANLFNNIQNTLIYAVIAVIVVICIVIFFKFESTRKLMLYLISVVIIATGIYSCIGLNDIFGVKSQEIGIAIHIETQKDYTSISYFDFGIISLESEDYVNYSNVTSFDTQEFDGTDKEYLILFNERPADNVITTSGSVSGVVILNFYDTDNEIIVTAELNVLIEYFAKETKVSTSIRNTNGSVSYLNSEMELYGAVIQVVERS